MSVYNTDEAKYVRYYLNQAGGELNGYIGTSTQYGAGLGGLFRSLFRIAVPLFKKGVSIVKPHLKTAASGIVSDVISNITKPTSTKQDGNGLYVYTPKPSKTPPTARMRDTPPPKKRKTTKPARKATKRRQPRGVKRPRTSRSKTTAFDIF